MLLGKGSVFEILSPDMGRRACFKLPLRFNFCVCRWGPVFLAPLYYLCGFLFHFFLKFFEPSVAQ